MGTCGILCGTTNGTSPIISNINLFRVNLRVLLAILERGHAGFDRTFNVGFALEFSVNVWKDIS
jgi:hypothetical protein